MEVEPRSVVEVVRIAPMKRKHLREVMRIEQGEYVRPWTTTLFTSELAQRTSRRYTVADNWSCTHGVCGTDARGRPRPREHAHRGEELAPQGHR